MTNEYTTVGRTTVTLEHGRVELALHCLREGKGARLLILHPLGSRSPLSVPAEAEAWPGAVWALDFTGHGESSVPVGGGYSAEILMADADVALSHLGPSTLLGYGLGAYVALLLAGSRPELVSGCVLCDGDGLEGGGPEPFEVGASVVTRPPAAGPPDSQALFDLSRDIRPPGYAKLFVRQAAHGSHGEPPITIDRAIERSVPPWLGSVLEVPGTARSSAAQALEEYSRAL